MDTDTTGLNLPARDAEGFLLDSKVWSPLLGEMIARELGLQLASQHWTVLEAARADFAATGTSPGLRRLSKLTGFPIKTFYDLFPDGPAKKIARAAGIPKPKSCL